MIPAPRKLQPFKNECSPPSFLPALLFIGLRIDARCPKHISKQPKTTFGHLLVFTDVYFYTDSQIENHQAGTLQRAPLYSTLIQVPRKLQAFNNKCSAIFSSQPCISILVSHWLSSSPFSGIYTYIYISLRGGLKCVSDLGGRSMLILNESYKKQNMYATTPLVPTTIQAEDTCSFPALRDTTCLKALLTIIVYI